MSEKENKIIAAIILAKTELKVLKLDLGPGMIAMAATISFQYTSKVNLMRQNGATFADVLATLTEEGNE